jgi:hypothetical protein
VISTCEFCGTENTYINKEHVIAKWLGKAILRTRLGSEIRMTRGGKVTRIPLATVKKGIKEFGLQVHCACEEKCNNGWMQKLEHKVDSFLGTMATTKDVVFLDLERRMLLSAWIAKTTMVYEFLNSRQYFTQQERNHVKSYLQPPNHTWIWITCFDGPQSLSGSPQHMILTRANGSTASGFSLTVSTGLFAFQLFSYRRPNWQRDEPLPVGPFRDVDKLIALWPPSNDGAILWPTPHIDDDGLNELRVRFLPSADRERVLKPLQRPPEPPLKRWI